MERDIIDFIAADCRLDHLVKTMPQRFDSTAFKKVMPDIYKSFTKQVSSKRFSIA